MNFRTEGHYKINYVILNAVKDLGYIDLILCI